MQRLGVFQMKLKSTAAILTALALMAVSSYAGQHQRHEGNRSEGSRGQDTDNGGQDNRERAVERPSAETPRARAPQAEAPAPQAPRQAAPAPRSEPQQTDPRRAGGNRRQNGQSNNGSGNSGGMGRAIPRVDPYQGRDNRVRGNRPIIVAPRYYNYGSRGYYSAPYRGYRPYSFRPRTRLNNYGIYLGFPVPYTYYYSYPVPVYGYGRPMAPMMIGPSSPYYGGVSLEISPSNAEVYVDGSYAGWVEDFDGTQQPLTLAAGRHRIEVEAPGYEPLVMDVVVNPGEVVPYRGSLLPYRY